MLPIVLNNQLLPHQQQQPVTSSPQQLVTSQQTIVDKPPVANAGHPGPIKSLMGAQWLDSMEVQVMIQMGIQIH